ncbi:scavenger mRNA decapping enzyme DcpS-like protein [Effusibacillus lacus]|nr:scavenger mRNA decapping enzyme DcpS-like protein [Effusibacillus lacus]
MEKPLFRKFLRLIMFSHIIISAHYEVHIVVILKRHVLSLLTLEESDTDLLIELIDVVKKVASQLVSKYGACRVMTNLGEYQDSKHLHWHVFW